MAAFNLIPIPGFDGYKLYHAIDWSGLRLRLGLGRGQKPAWRQKDKAPAKAAPVKPKAVSKAASKDPGKADASTKAAKADPVQARRLADQIMAEAKREYDKGKS